MSGFSSLFLFSPFVSFSFMFIILHLTGIIIMMVPEHVGCIGECFGYWLILVMFGSEDPLIMFCILLCLHHLITGRCGIDWMLVLEILEFCWFGFIIPIHFTTNFNNIIGPSMWDFMMSSAVFKHIVLSCNVSCLLFEHLIMPSLSLK
jgi:hypothetical protein